MPPLWSSAVRYVECDQQGVVFNAHYLTWADEASNRWWASHGLPWDEVAALCQPVVEASSLEWTSSARWGDTVEVDADTERLGTTSVTVRYTVRVGGRVCCVVRNTYVAIGDGRPTPRPEPVRAALRRGRLTPPEVALVRRRSGAGKQDPAVRPRGIGTRLSRSGRRCSPRSPSGPGC